MKNVIARVKLVMLNFALLAVTVAAFIPNLAFIACKSLAGVIGSGIESAKLEIRS